MLHYNFNSIYDLITTMGTEAEAGKGTKLALNQFLTGTGLNSEWTGGITQLDQYIDTLKLGYLPAVDEFKSLSINQEGQKENLLPAVCGQFGDVSKYLNNEPECMYEFNEVQENKFLILHISGVSSYKMNGAILMDKCKTIFNCVNNLELTGTRVKIYLSIATTETKPGAKIPKHKQIKVLIKDFNEGFVPGYHGLLIGHLATIRGLFYAYMSIHNKKPSLGGCIDSEILPGEIYVPIRSLTNEQIINTINQAPGQ